MIFESTNPLQIKIFTFQKCNVNIKIPSSCIFLSGLKTQRKIVTHRRVGHSRALKTSHIKINVWIVHRFLLHEKYCMDSVILLKIYF